MSSSSFLLATQRVNFEISNPVIVSWGKTKALRFDLYIVDDKEKERILIKIPGFILREFGLSVPQRKIGDKYINLIYIPEETLHVIEERVISEWGNEKDFSEIRFPKKNKEEEKREI